MRRRDLLVYGLVVTAVPGWWYWSVGRAPRTADDLRAAAATADRVVVLHGTLGRDESRYLTRAFESRGADEVAELLRAVDLTGPVPACACGGNYRIDLYRGERLIVRMTFHHGTRLVFEQPWRGCVGLTPGSGRAVADWFAGRGFTGFREVLEDEPGWQIRG